MFTAFLYTKSAAIRSRRKENRAHAELSGVGPE